MKIQITRPSRVDGKTCAVGDVVDTDRKTAEYLIAIRKAKAPDKMAKTKTNTAAD